VRPDLVPSLPSWSAILPRAERTTLAVGTRMSMSTARGSFQIRYDAGRGNAKMVANESASWSGQAFARESEGGRPSRQVRRRKINRAVPR